MGFLDRYTPVLGAEGEVELSLVAGVIESITPLPPNASAATIAAHGGRVLYKVNGEDPGAGFGRPIPDGDEIILTNLEMMMNCRITQESDDCTAYIQFYTNG